MKFTTGFVFSLISALSLAQNGKLKKADDYYAKLSYSLAVELYEDLLASELSSPQIQANLAHCYYAQGDLAKSEEMYREATKTEGLQKEHYFNFAQVLKQMGNYKESDQWMKLFYEKNNTDKRAISYIENTNYFENIEAEGTHFEIELAKYNSTSADFGGYHFPPSNINYVVSSRKKRIVKNYWSWDGSSFLDLYQVDSSNQVSYFSPTINTSFHEGPLCFSSDNKTVYFTRNNIAKGKNRRDEKGIQNLKMYRAQVEANGSWKNVEELSINSKDYSVGHPTISADGKILYFVSDMPGGYGGADLYRLEIREDGTLGKPENLGENINTEGQEMFPWVSKNNELFFSSNGHIGLGGLDVFVCKIEETGFSSLKNCGRPMNSLSDDFAFNLNDDGLSGQFSSNRAGGVGDDDIYTFNLVKSFVFEILLSGQVSDEESKEILAGAEITLLDANGNAIQKVIADNNGEYSFSLKPGQTYSILVTKEDYEKESDQITLGENSGQKMRKDFELNKIPTFELYGLIKDNKTGEELKDVEVKIVDKTNGEIIFEGTTSSNGEFNKVMENLTLNDRISYDIALSKEGYLTKTANLNLLIEKPGRINIHEHLDVGLAKVEIGIDLASLIEIKPIYFDLGKSNIRKDAAVELEKIIKVMNEYPNMEIELGSHTDCRSSKAFNMSLSTKRAVASANYIKKRISKPERISGKGYGESKLKIDCPCEGAVKSDCSEEEHQQNRRTEFIILKM